MKNSKTIIGSLVLIFLASILFSGFTVSAETNVEFWTWALSPTYDDYINNMVEEFESQHPDVDVTWNDQPWTEMEKKLQAVVASGDAPDVVNMNPTISVNYAQRGLLVNLDKALKGETINKYFRGPWDASRAAGNSYGFPWYLSTTVTFYNTELMEEAGIEEPPSNWEELFEVSKKVKEETGKFGFAPHLTGSDLFLRLMSQYGVRLYNDSETKAMFNSEAGAEFLSMFVEAYEKGWIPKDSININHREAIQKYASGQAAVQFTGPQLLRLIKDQNKEVYNNTKVTKSLVGAQKNYNVSVMNVVVFEKEDKEKQEAAVELAKFVTNGDNQLTLAKKAGVFPSVKEAARAEYFTEAGETLESKAISTASEQLWESFVAAPLVPNYSQIKQRIHQTVQEALLGKKSPQKALDEAAEKVTELLNEEG